MDPLRLSGWQELPLAQKVAQMLVVRASGFLFDHQIRYPQWEAEMRVLQHWVAELGVGGVILLGGSTAEIALKTQQLQSWASLPLLICADVEEGVEQRFSGATWFPPPMALGAIAAHNLTKAAAYAEQMGAVTAQEALAIGINWLLAPVVDVNNNPLNPVINLRAFGETPGVVSALTQAFIRGAHHHAVLTTAKHFPGHGDTTVDSHIELPVLHHTPDRLAQVELPPFQSAIAAGVDAVMTAHLMIPAWDSQFPATLSQRILTGELRQTLGFKGLIVTDALVMGAIADRYGAHNAAVLAVQAGADIVLMPSDPVGAIQAICQAVEMGQISLARIHHSLERIWQAKHSLSSHTPPKDNGQQTTDHKQQTPFHPPHLTLVHSILQDSLLVHAPEQSRLEQPRWKVGRRNLILVDDGLNCKEVGHWTPAIALPRQQHYSLHLVDRHTPPLALVADAQPWQPTLLQVFIRGNPFRGSAGANDRVRDWFQFLIDTEALMALVIYGSPYVLEQFTTQLPADVPYVFTHGQMPAAQNIALTALPGFQ